MLTGVMLSAVCMSDMPAFSCDMPRVRKVMVVCGCSGICQVQTRESVFFASIMGLGNRKIMIFTTRLPHQESLATENKLKGCLLKQACHTHQRRQVLACGDICTVSLAYLISLSSCWCLFCHRWAIVHPLRVLSTVKEGKWGTGP